jgi:hypothetical protein
MRSSATLLCALLWACGSAAGPRPSYSAPNAGELDRVVAALATMPGMVRSVSEGSAQMQEFTFDPVIVKPIEAAGDRAVAKLVECYSKTDVEYAPTERALWEAQQLWREYPRTELPNQERVVA